MHPWVARVPGPVAAQGHAASGGHVSLSRACAAGECFRSVDGAASAKSVTFYVCIAHCSPFTFCLASPQPSRSRCVTPGASSHTPSATPARL